MRGVLSSTTSSTMWLPGLRVSVAEGPVSVSAASSSFQLKLSGVVSVGVVTEKVTGSQPTVTKLAGVAVSIGETLAQKDSARPSLQTEQKG